MTDIRKAGVGVSPSACGEQGKGPILASAREETIVGMTQTASLTAVVRQRYKHLHKLVQLGGLRRWKPLSGQSPSGMGRRRAVFRGAVSPRIEEAQKMSRLTRIAMLLACAVGVGFPTSSEAGIIPWAYDAIFGPVGSMRQSYSTPYYTGYSGYVGTNYQPAAYSYGYATNGCSSCQQSSYYSQAQSGCGCSPCGSSCGYGCSSGGCASGGCASGNCTVNSAPNGSLSPVADPSNYSRGIETRLEAIEKHLNIVPPRENTGTQPRTYDADRFGPSRRPRSTDGLDDGTAVPPREGNGQGTRRSGTGNVIDDGTFSKPDVRNPSHGKTTDPNDEFFKGNPAPRSNTDGTSTGPRETFKVNTEKANTELKEAPMPADPDLVIPKKEPVPTGPAIEEKNGPQTLRLDSRITSKAVSPRERQTIVVGFQKPVVARTKAPTTIWAGNPQTTDLAQRR